MTKTVLITGVAGLLGSRLADWILKNKPDIKVVGIDNLSGGFMSNVDDRVKFFNRNLSIETGTVEEVFEMHKPDVVYHFAAYAAECLSPFIRRFNYSNNVVATANIVNMCIKYKVKRLVFSSSMAVYGHGVPPFDEIKRPVPVDPYGVAKYACEMDIQIAGRQHDLDWCILRPHNVYGAKQNIWDPYRNVIGIFMYKALVGDSLTIYGDGKQTRAFSCIDDSLEPMWKAGVDPRASKQIINLGGTEEHTINELAETVKDAMPCHLGRCSDVIHLPPRHEVREAYSTYDKSIELLDFEHNISLWGGVCSMWDWVGSQPKRERKSWESYEIDEGLYPYWTKEAIKDGFWVSAKSEV